MFLKKEKERLRKREISLSEFESKLDSKKKEYENYLESVNANFLKHLIHQIGDLIHYQSQDYKKEYPIDSIVYNHIGTILRSMSPSEHNYKTVLELVKHKSHISNTIPKEILEPLMNFDAVGLVDLTSRMQGITKDDSFLESLSFFKNLQNQKSK